MTKIFLLLVDEIVLPSQLLIVNIKVCKKFAKFYESTIHRPQFEQRVNINADVAAL